jgi:hypothetical protein
MYNFMLSGVPAWQLRQQIDTPPGTAYGADFMAGIKIKTKTVDANICTKTQVPLSPANNTEPILQLACGSLRVKNEWWE